MNALQSAVTSGLDRRVGPRCLVTGSAGYVGRHLVDALLALGCEVRGFDVVPHDREGLDARLGDLRDARAVRAACEGVDVVFHTAAVLTLLGIARRDVRQRVLEINVGGTDRVIEAARAAGVGRLVYTSSANVAIDRELVEADESVGYAQSFVDRYGESKVLAERAVLAADGVRGLRTAAVRPGGIWGPGSGGYMIETFLDQLAAGRFVATIGDGRAVVDNTHVYNVVRAMLLAAARLREAPDVVGGQAYFVTDDERINGIEWFRPIVEALGHRFPERKLPGRAMYAIGLASEVAHALGGPEPALTRIGVLKLIRSSSFSIDKARRELGYAPLVQRDEGMRLHMPDYRAAYDARRGVRAVDHGAGKRVLLVWDREGRSRSERRTLLLGTVAPRLRDAGARKLSMLIADEDADLKSPSPFPQPGPDPIALVNAWVDDDASARALIEVLAAHGLEVAGYAVDESVYTDYGGNRHAAPRDWPDGSRSPGVVAISLLQRPRRLSREEWIRRWHGTMSPVSERMQPRCRYVRNLVLGPITPNAPPYEGIVEEAWPSVAHATEPMLFYGAKSRVELVRNMAVMVRTVSSFLDIHRVRTFFASEYFVATSDVSARAS
jgi:3beta-hydroxy-delta5-steroid dehydrogenase/steroid delta-isomerase